MEKSRISKKLAILIAMFFILASTGSCRNNSDSQTPEESAQIVGDFPLKEYWKKDLKGELKAMALDSGMLITGIVDNDGAVIQAFDIATGSSLWKSDLPGDSIGINIMMVDKLVYIIFAPKLFAIDLDTGNIIFETDIGASIVDEIAAVSGEQVFVVQVSEGVFAYDRFTGKLSWQIFLGRGNVDVFSDTTHDLVYIVHGEYLKAVNEKDGNLAWQIQIGLHGVVGYHDGILYYSTSKIKGKAETQIQALDLEAKSQLWENELGNEVDCISTENNGVIAIATETIVMVDPKSGEKTWEYYIPLGVYCPLAMLDGVIYLKDGSSNQVVAMQQENGNLILLGRLDFEDSGGIGYKTPRDNLLSSTYPFPLLVFYLNHSVYVYK
jgi:outer membrane protein assembly factor BamB